MGEVEAQTTDSTPDLPSILTSQHEAIRDIDRPIPPRIRHRQPHLLLLLPLLPPGCCCGCCCCCCRRHPPQHVILSRGRHRPHDPAAAASSCRGCIALHPARLCEGGVERRVAFGVEQQGRQRGLGHPSEPAAVAFLQARNVQGDTQDLAGDERLTRLEVVVVVVGATVDQAGNLPVRTRVVCGVVNAGEWGWAAKQSFNAGWGHSAAGASTHHDRLREGTGLDGPAHHLDPRLERQVAIFVLCEVEMKGLGDLKQEKEEAVAEAEADRQRHVCVRWLSLWVGVLWWWLVESWWWLRLD
jgi:hypothetical protein